MMTVFVTDTFHAAYKGDSDAYIDANAQLAIRAGLQIHEQTGKNVVVLLPDSGELKRSAELFKSSLELYEGVTLSHLFEGREPLKKRLSQLFGMDAKQAAPAAAAEADVHLVINITSNELPDVRQYQQEVLFRSILFPLRVSVASASPPSLTNLSFAWERVVTWSVRLRSGRIRARCSKPFFDAGGQRWVILVFLELRA